MISKFTRHLGPKCRGDHSPRIRFPILVACCTSPRMEILPVPRLVVFGCSYPFTQDIGPGLSFYAIGDQGKIGPHNIYIFEMNVGLYYSLPQWYFYSFFFLILILFVFLLNAFNWFFFFFFGKSNHWSFFFESIKIFAPWTTFYFIRILVLKKQILENWDKKIK